MRNLAKAGEHQWKDFQDDLGSSRRELQSELRNCIETFKAGPGAADLHNGDDGPFPYGELSGCSTEKIRQRGIK